MVRRPLCLHCRKYPPRLGRSLCWGCYESMAYDGWYELLNKGFLREMADGRF